MMTAGTAQILYDQYFRPFYEEVKKLEKEIAQWYQIMADEGPFVPM